MIIAPTGVPKNLVLLETKYYNLTWDELHCSEQNGLITGYTVLIINSSVTYNLTSTNTHIILNDLVFNIVYSISVAAVNAIGSGPFSDHITIGRKSSYTVSLQSDLFPFSITISYIIRYS